MMDCDAKYLVGYILGDGMVRRYGRVGYEIKLTEKNYEHAIYLASLLTGIVGVRPKIARDKHSRSWRVRVFRKKAYEKINYMVKKALSEPDRHLIGGLFDAEGDYTVSKKRLRFTNTNPILINIVSYYLNKIGIRHYIYKRKKEKNTWLVIEIYGKNINKLLPHLDLRHPKWYGKLLTTHAYK